MEIETKKEETINSETGQSPERSRPVSFKGKRSYWEFGLFVAIAMTLAAVVSVLGFLLARTLSDQEGGKVSIQTISIGMNQPGSSPGEGAVKIEESKKIEENKGPVVEEVISTEVVIKVLNGGAPGGSAGKAKEVLLAKGYKKVEAGNSEKSDYVGVVVFYQAEMRTSAEKVVADLKAQYPTAQAKAGVSTEEKSSSIVVMLGK